MKFLRPLFALVAIVALSLVYSWIATWGRTGLFDAPHDYRHLVSAKFYDAQAEAMLSGRLDVPCRTTSGESFLIDRKCHGYFGPTPALLRIPLNALFPGLEGRWSRFMMLTASLLAAIMATWLAWRFLRAEPNPGWEKRALLFCCALAFSLGGSSIFILGNPFTYHEAIVWGSTLAVAAFLLLDLALERDSEWWLVGVILLGALAANARVTVGLGPLLALGFVLVLVLGRRFGLEMLRGVCPDYRAWRAGVALALVLAAAATPFLWNLLRFGSSNPPLNRHVIYSHNPARLEQARKGILIPRNIPCTVTAYWSPRSIGTSPHFPWVVPGLQVWQLPNPYPPEMKVCEGSTVNYSDPVTALPYAMPAQLLLALLGAASAWSWGPSAWKRSLGPILGAAIASVPIYLYHTISYRYVQDQFPLLVLLGALGICTVARIRLRSVRWSLVGFLILLSLWGFYMNVSAALTHNLPQPEAIHLLMDMR